MTSTRTKNQIEADLKAARSYIVALEGELAEFAGELAPTSTATTSHQNTERQQEISQVSANLQRHTEEERYRTLFEDAPVMYTINHFVADELFIFNCNTLFYQTLGYTYEEIVGQPLCHFYTPHSTQLLRNGGLQQVLQGDTHLIERELICKDGEVIPCLLQALPLHDAHGQIIGTRAAYINIKERKTAERAQATSEEQVRKLIAQKEHESELRQHENLYRALFESSNDAIFLMTPERKSWRFNQRAADLLEYMPESIIGIQSDQPQTSADQPDIDARLQAVLYGVMMPRFERRFIAGNGEIRSIEVTLSPIRDDAGKVVLIQALARDITARKQAEAKIRQSQEALQQVNVDLERANRFKDEFLATMSHELRTPLNAVLAFAELLLEQIHGPLNERQLRSIRTIETSGKHLLTLINDILDVASIETNKLGLEIETISLDEICNASLLTVRETVQKKNLALMFSSNMPTVMIRADPRRLKQIVTNLLSNAVKFTPAGGKVGLEIEADPQRGTIELAVKDTGIGIAKADLERLFTPFVQVDSSLSRQHEGTGLGLILVRRLAELHGGKIQVQSDPGQGSCFTVILPWDAHMTEE